MLEGCYTVIALIINSLVSCIAFVLPFDTFDDRWTHYLELKGEKRF